MIHIFTACCAASYIIGSVPFGFIISRAKGIDIRTVGSGNIGATNVLRALGKRWGIFTFFLDVMKGFIAAFVLPQVAAQLTTVTNMQALQIVCTCFVVAGHNWPVFLRFKGGKGIATTAGALLGIAPIPLGAGLLTWIIMFYSFRYVSLASIIASIVIPVCGWILHSKDGLVIPVFLSIIGALAIVRHISNIQRLIKGTESKFERKKK